jgi:apolipoprotein N-acyltransferase
MNKYTNILLSLASGLLLFAAWPVSPLTLLIFFAWIPLLWLEERVSSRKKFFGLTYITMFIWNVATTWWIWNASAPGAVSAFLANSLLMCFPWLGFKIVKKRMGEKMGYASLIAFWMCFEYIHLQDWGLSWPWLTLGNAFAIKTEWVQWYEYTGTSGGTLWILLVNILLFIHLRKNSAVSEKRNFRYIIAAALLLAFPILLSSITGFDLHKGNNSSSNIVVVQPNIDPYEKVSDEAGSFEAQLQRLISTTEKAVDSNTALFVWPETALYMMTRLDEATLKENFFLNPLWSLLKKYPKASLFTGIESYRQFREKTKYAQEFNGYYYESYNGSVLLDSSGTHGFYHKSMLVPGVETLPWFLKFLSKWFDKFGGTTAGYAKQDHRTVIEEKNGYKIAPAICYESIYGDFMRRYIQNGANLICIVTNDGWWKKTPGHKQHMNYARLRAIETRTWVARSANTGISCFIDPYGKVINPQPYNTNAAIKYNIPAVENKTKTFFVRFGDVLSKIMAGISLLIVVSTIIFKIKKKTIS